MNQPIKTGRKPFYDNVEDLEAAIEEYFRKCDEGTTVEVVRKGEAVQIHKAIPYTVPGLANALGFMDRQSIIDLAGKDAFSCTIQRARNRISQQRVEKALLGEQDSRFAQFDLINNHGYLSAKEQVQTTVQITYTDDEIDNRLAALEGKMYQLERPENARIIDGEFQVKLLE